jgi:hypothetical protein
MGFHSWHTTDTKKTIPCIHSEKEVFTVFMHDQNGNVWEEPAYDGYGDFGGKNYYSLLAEMNGLGKGCSEDEKNGIGIGLVCDRPQRCLLYPNLTTVKEWKYKQTSPKECRWQGFFYPGTSNYIG